MSLKLLHTSDWHLGRNLYGRKRYEEFEAFLDWLTETIQENEVDVLLVAGDVFDTSTPSNRAQELYYSFLRRIAGSCCRHVVIIAGNHDSPSFLTAPKAILKALDVHVVGAATETLDDEVIGLSDLSGQPELYVCAVPYLRDRDIRQVEAGESIEDKERKLLDGISNHYSKVVALAEKKRSEHGKDIPIVGMGHLFTAGGKTVDGDGVRELYVGSLAHVTSSIFPDSLDYVALGHLHVPQKVNDSELIRYSGSPIPMGFGEAKQKKRVCVVEFNSRSAAVKEIDVPKFRQLERLTGDWEAISTRIAELIAFGSAAWLEVVYQGESVVGDLRERLDEALEGSQLEVLRIKNNRIIERVMEQASHDESLDELDLNQVFERCLDQHAVSDEQRDILRDTYRETLASIHEDDARAE
ncbi:MAG: exonuclease SbcCD subunit D C-terminal domain-containing protein [Methylophaga sp.]|uniref:exonuclease SbcCD subunit D C-terminal domain-containing protein n=1 Tax=Methylophaga sp. TaxID=2024840 RepID=UPI00299F51AE|nr:exonuclease SbcCD subunit D C-terminal domain-containing protein [Methylophaga sp.]MDX1749046.1 exonuclease SbcCD subunit D C-terminal domain-containing protein [Methylophaga sp.]